MRFPPLQQETIVGSGRFRYGGQAVRTAVPSAETRTFDPEITRLMGTAFEDAWDTLREADDRLATPLVAAYSRNRGGAMWGSAIQLSSRMNRFPILKNN
jgi:hypothetical protein